MQRDLHSFVARKAIRERLTVLVASMLGESRQNGKYRLLPLPSYDL